MERYRFEAVNDPRTRASLAKPESVDLRDQVELLIELLAPIFDGHYNCQGVFRRAFRKTQAKTNNP